MDDTLEQPSFEVKLPVSSAAEERDDEGTASDDEDGGPDWTKLVPRSHLVVIPKRGEKQFEPAAGGETNLQQRVLERARDAMFTTLGAARTISNKSISYAIWHPSLARAEVLLSRGVLFNSLGHSAPRPAPDADDPESGKIKKRMELLPEEVIYLVERGSLLCWKNINEFDSDLAKIHGSPMTVQQAYSELIGTEDLTLERFEVYAYLKRLGYVVTRADPPTPYYPQPPPYPSLVKKPITFFRWLYNSSTWFLHETMCAIRWQTDWWQPFSPSKWLRHVKNYPHVFHSFRFLPAGFGIPLTAQPHPPSPSPYQIFWNLYKPPTPFRKTAPPCPEIMVTFSARTTPMPTLYELNDLFDIYPELPPPVPRKRLAFGGREEKKAQQQRQTVAPAAELPLTGWQRMFSWWPFPTPPSPPPPRRTNPFMMLKAGEKMVVIAVVDSGNLGFFRFSQGVFTDWPMI